MCDYTKDGFIGTDLINTAVPQNFGIVSLEDVYSFYVDEQTSLNTSTI